MGPAYTRRYGQRLRYYVTHAKCIVPGEPAAYRIAAESIEHHCLTILAKHQAGQVRSIDEANAAARARNAFEKRQLVCDHIHRVIIGDAELTIELKGGAIVQRSLDRVRIGNDAKLIVGSQPPDDTPACNQQLIVLLRNAARVQSLALARPKLSLDALASKFGRSPERFKRLIRLSYLSPRIVTAILQGQQPVDLTNRGLQHLDGLPIAWSEQENMLLS